MRRASLNHIYRLVWSEREQAFIAVAENVRTKGKSSGICRSLAALVGIGLSAFSYADGVVVAPGSGATNVYTAPNGVPVVDIDKANAAGLSHNKYLNYNVGTNGLILNNANSSQMSRQSQLAGQVMANTNLSAEAKVILNEVVTTNRSTLQGYTEVVGGKADVILANPYGITCNGCGFINTDRVTLTTGTPNISNTGALSGFTINGGDIFIDGAGLDGMKQSYFDIVTRTFRMNAQLNGKDVKIITGTNQWDYLTQTASAITPTGTAPTFAFDSSLLGGMYSNRIFIQATEAGVGVKMLGEAATTADDFTISAAGKIDIRSKVSAERNLAITSTSNATDAIGLADANLSVKNNLILTANNGGATLNGGLLVASNDLTGVLGSLTDNANATAVTDNNKRYAKGNVSLTVTNAATIDGTNWGSAAASDYNVGSLNIGAAGATLYADTSLSITANSGNLALAKAAIKATDNLNLTSSNGSISTTAGAGQGIQTTAGNLAVTTGSDFSNAGVISADTGSVTVRSNGTVTNSGTLHAATTMDIADKNNAATENVSNTGTLLVDGTLSAKANNFSNAGSLQGTAGVNLSAVNLTNSGTFIASNTAGKSGTFSNLTTLDNSGTLQSAEDLTLNVSGTMTNSGKLLATHDLAVLAGTSALDISNTATGILQANNALNITGSNATLDRQLGTILGNNEVNLTLANFDNRGTLQSNASIHYAMANRFSNAGTVLAKNTLTGSSADLTNSGTLQANQGATITATNAISNTGSLIVSSGAAFAGTLTAATLSNSGAGNIQSAHDLTINLTGDSLVNESKILADDDLTISATSTAVINNRTDGFIQAGTGAGDDLTITGNALTLNNNIGATLLGDRLAFTALDVSNDGTVQGGAGASSVTITNALTNKGLFSLANATGGSGSITADSILNYETLQSAGGVNLNIASQLTNNNRLLADGALTIRGTDSSYSVTNAKTLQAGGLLDIKGQSNGSGVSITVDTSGVMLGNSMDVNADTLTVNEGGMVSSIAAMTLGLNTLSFGGSTSRIVGSTDGSSTTAITLANSFTNPGAVFSAGNLNVTAPSITNSNTGGISALREMNLTASTNDIVNQGTFYAAGNMNLRANSGSIINSSIASTGGINSDATVTTNSFNFNNSGDINAANITVNATNSFYNGVATIPSIFEDWANAVYGARTLIKDSGKFDCNGVGLACQQYWVYERTITVNQKLSSALPATKPQMLASGTMNINWGAGGGRNVAGILSANTLNLAGTGSFVNQDLHLEQVTYGQHWMVDEDDCTLCKINYIFRYANANQYFDVASLGKNGGEVGWVTGHGEWLELSRAGSWNADQEAAARDVSAKVDIGRTLLSTSGAGIFAQTLNYSGGSLANRGSAFTPSIKSTSQTGATATSLSNGTTATTGVAAVAGTTLVNGSSTVVFNGLVISLPTNPNGFFVVSKDPQSKYLVETNPMFSSGQNFVGSNYLAKRLGVNTDQINLRLGNAAYENYVIRQQLIDQTGKNILNGYASEDKMIEGMYTAASNKSTSLGLSWGKPLSAEQIGKLTEDIVWMVETVVEGKTVLAPVVYLSKATKEGVQTGAVIAATDTNIKTDILSNTGGSISGSKTLDITSKGDITNTSGRIQGGDVSLTSTEGSIVNKTVGGTTENPTSSNLGKTASIQSTGNLSLDAKKDISVIGAEVKAGKDATLTAGENVTLDTVVSKTATNSTSKSNGEIKNEGKVTTTNTGSTLETGGNLKISSGKDTTIASSKVNTGGNLAVDAKGDLNIVDRHDKVETNTSSSSGNVGSFFTDSKSETTKTVDTTSKGSSISVGGNADLNAGKTVTLQGSDLKVTGDATVTATDVKVLAGKNTHDSTTVTKTHTFMGNSNTESGSSSGASSEAKFEKDSIAGQASASAKAEAEAHSSSTFDIVNDKTTTKVTSDVTHTGSTISAGNLKINAKKDVTLEGANIAAEKNVSVSGETVNITTAVDTHSVTTKVDEKAFRLSSDNSVKAEAGASAEAGTTKMSAEAEASAKAQANTDNFSGYLHNEITTTEKSTTNKGTSIKSGGDTSLTSNKDLNLTGAKVDAGGNVDLTSTKGNINIQAAHDTEDRTSTVKTMTIGLYGTADAQAGATTSAAAKLGKIGVDANVDATAIGGVGFQYSDKTQDETKGSSTAVVSSIKSGGDLTRTATAGKITDEGTAIDVGGNLTQSAKEIEMKAAANTEYATNKESSEKFRLGVYGEAGASGQAEAKAGLVTTASVDGEAHAIGGIQLTNKYSKSDSSSNKSTAVVSNVKVGGNLNSTSTGKTTLEGTVINTGGDANITASELEYKAARDTESSTSNSLDTNLSIKLGGGVAASGGSGGGGAGLQAQGALKFSAEGDNKKAESSTATAGSITSGGKLNLKTTEKDLKLEGTNLTSAGDMSLAADKGSVIVDAARSTSSSTGTGWDAGMNLSGEVGAGKKSAGIEASGGYKDSDKAKSTGVASNIKSGGNLNVSAGKDAKFEGTTLEAAGDAKVDAKNNVEFNAVKNTETSKKFDVNADVSVGGNAKGKSVEGSLEAGFSYENNNKVTYNAASIKSGGKSSVNAGGDVTLQGDVKIGTVDAKGNIVNDDKAITAGGTVKKVETKNVDEKTKFGLDIAVDFEGKGKSAADKTKAADGRSHDAKINEATAPQKASDAKDGSYKKADEHLENVKKTTENKTKDAENKLTDAKKELNDAQTKLDKTKVDANDYSNAKKELESAQTKAKDAEKQVKETKSDEAKNKLADAKKQLNEAQTKLDKVKQDTKEQTKAKQEFDAAQTKTQNAQKQVNDTKTAGEKQVKQATDKVTEMKKQADAEHDKTIDNAKKAVTDTNAANQKAIASENKQRKNDVATNKAEALKKAVEDTDKKLKDAKTNSDKLQDADAVKALKNLESDSSSADKKLVDAKNEATTLKDDAEKLQKTAEEKKVTADKSKSDSISQAKTAAENKIADAIKTAATEKSKIDNDKNLKPDAKIEAKKKIDAELATTKKLAKTEKEQAINKAQADHKQATVDAKALSKQAVEKTKEAELKVATAETDAADKKDKLDVAVKEREQVKKDLDDAQKQFDDLTSAKDKLKTLDTAKEAFEKKLADTRKQAADEVLAVGKDADAKKKQAEADKQLAITNKDKAGIKKAEEDIAAANKLVADAKEKAFNDVRKVEETGRKELKEANREAMLEHSKESLAAKIKASDEKIADVQTAIDKAQQVKSDANKTLTEKETAQKDSSKKLDDANSAKQKAEDAVKQNPKDAKAQENLKKATQAVEDANKAKQSADTALADAKKAKVNADKTTGDERIALAKKQALLRQKEAADAELKALTDKKTQFDEAKKNAATQLADAKTKADQLVKDAEAKVTAATTPEEKTAAETVLEETKAKAETDKAAAEKLHDETVATADRKYEGAKKAAKPTNYSIMDDIKKGGDKGVELTMINQVVEIPKNATNVTAVTEDGEALPDWVKFDAKTGTFTGVPPKDYEGDLKVVIKAVQEDGTVKSISVEIDKRKKE